MIDFSVECHAMHGLSHAAKPLDFGTDRTSIVGDLPNVGIDTCCARTHPLCSCH